MPGNSSFVAYNYRKLLSGCSERLLVKKEAALLWQKNIKRAVDIVAALSGLICLFPLMIYVAIRVKLDSRGPVFYFQERLGFKGVPFIIYKFRSMVEGAEQNGPTLSFVNDNRVTNWGRTMRTWKLDELPQLFNVLIGTMSLVGPRPERKYYIDIVSPIYPYFDYLHQVKPGLTSLGMIKFGYARNVAQIIQRMKYDVEYVERYSLLLDFKILYYTLPSIIGSKKVV